MTLYEILDSCSESESEMFLPQKVTMGGDGCVLTRLLAVITLQHAPVSNHHVVHFTTYTMSCAN